MKKKITKVIAGVLVAGMFIGNLSPLNVYGMGEQISVGVEKLETEEVSEEVSEEIFNEISQDQENLEDNAVGAHVSSEEQAEMIEDNGETEITYGDVNFVYIESPYIKTPDTERIVFSFDKEIRGAETIVLTVVDSMGNQEEWELVNQVGSLYLFEKEYIEEVVGTYKVVNLIMRNASEEKEIVLSDIDVEAEFGVNDEYEGIEELKLIEGENVANQSEVEASVVTIDENGISEAQNSISEALEVVSEKNDISANVFEKKRRNSADTNLKAGNIVVALDPGHDANDAGAQGNGLREEELTLKIANYCKQELEQYAGVTVYMTRTGSACPYNKPGITCMEDRVKSAVKAGAQIFVSFHLNSSVASSANGAEVIVPNNSWKAEVGAEGRELGEAILDELVALGLTRRSVYSKDTTINERYPDGSLSDYYSVQIHCKEHGIPGLIVEHAFISNSGDANNFLKTEAGLKKIGVADATGIAKYLGLSKGYWEIDSKGNKYYYVNGEKVKGTYKIGNDFYYFDKNLGVMYTGWREDGGVKYYYDKDGRLTFGVKNIEGAWYYFKENNGIMYTGWREDGGAKYYYGEEGKLTFGVKNIEGAWYYFKENNGMMYTGWREDGGAKYYYGEEGKLTFGVKNIEGAWYYFKENNGMMHTGWRELDGVKYYYGKDGKLTFGVKNIENAWYYFKENNGMMHTGWREDGGVKYYYGEDGRLLFGSQKISGNWYYFNQNSAAMHTGWREEGDKIYYYDLDGKEARGVKKISGNWYYFNENTGAMHTGWRKTGKDTYYYDENGHLSFGIKKVGESWYYFNENTGTMHTGWRQDGKNTYYYDENGKLTFGKKVIDGKEYCFDKNTGILILEKIDLMEIEGKSNVTVEQMVKLYNYNKDKKYPYPAEELKKGGAGTIKELAQIFYEEAEAEGIKVEVAWCQSMLETGWLKFGGQVKVNQFNFAGLGAIDGGAKGADFSGYGKEGVRMGVRAQIQHLKAYANEKITEEKLKYPCVDPRFKYVSPKGCAKYVEYLGQQENPIGKGWATSKNYGYRILELINELKEM